ncbi:MAG: S24/S26 family peptidase [Thomasclavelia spiroformis]
MKIDTKIYLSFLKEMIEQNMDVSIVISGNSMSPFLVNQRDVIYLSKINRKLKKGDLVLYQRLSGQYVVHRIVKVKKSGYYLAGDNQIAIEGPILDKQIFGLVTKVKRKGKWIEAGNFWWEFFEHVWIWVVPWRMIILNNIKKFVKFK